MRAPPAPLSRGSQFIFFSWILHKLYIKPCSANSFRYLTFKLLCLGLALFFLLSFFFLFHLLLVLFIRLCIPLPPPKTSAPSAFCAHPCDFFLSHESAYSEVAEFTGVYETWWGWGKRKVQFIVPSSPRGLCFSARLVLVKVTGDLV